MAALHWLEVFKCLNHSLCPVEWNIRLIQLATVKTSNINKSYELFVFFIMLKVVKLSSQNEFYCFRSRALFTQVFVLFCVVFVLCCSNCLMKIINQVFLESEKQTFLPSTIPPRLSKLSSVLSKLTSVTPSPGIKILNLICHNLRRTLFLNYNLCRKTVSSPSKLVTRAPA